MGKKIVGLGSLPQAEIDWTQAVHVRENTQTNEDHLNANRRKFTGDCAIILSLLQKGQVITSKGVYMQWNVSSLPRRIKDLRDHGGVDNIEDQNILNDDGRTTRNKIWFMRDRLSEETKAKYHIK